MLVNRAQAASRKKRIREQNGSFPTAQNWCLDWAQFGKGRLAKGPFCL
jgi:hypothetical protein